jgi:hypothetical protein
LGKIKTGQDQGQDSPRHHPRASINSIGNSNNNRQLRFPSATATMVTRSQARAHFDHVCNTVLRRDDDSLLKKALVQEGFDTIPSLLSIDDDTILSLAFKDEENRAVVINRGDVTLLKSFRNFVVTRTAGGITVEDEWLTMTAEDFDTFRVRSIGMPSIAPWRNKANVATTETTSQAAVAFYQRGLKRNCDTPITARDVRRTLVPVAVDHRDVQPQVTHGICQRSTPGGNLATVSEVTTTGTAESITNDLEREDDASPTLSTTATSGSYTSYTPIKGEVQHVTSNPNTRDINTANTVYTVSAHRSSQPMSLVDRGANGGLAGDDVRVVGKIFKSVDIRGIDNHQVTDIGVGTVGGVVTTQKGPVVAIFHQYALLGKGPSIHSSAQLEHYKNNVNDRSLHLGGLQRVKTLDGYVIPLNIKDGLPRLELRPYTDKEWDQLPHVIMTAETDWDPSVIDHALDEDEHWFDAVEALEENPTINVFDEYGNYKYRVHDDACGPPPTKDPSLNEETPASIEHLIIECMQACHTASVAITDDDPTDDAAITVDAPQVSRKEPDYERLRPRFGWLSTEIIKRTFQLTTQYAHLPVGTLLKRRYKSPNPALNVFRRNEALACDVVYSDTPAIDNGAKLAVIFVGLDTQVTDIYGIKSDKQFVNTLEDNIRERGAPNKLISDRGSVIIGENVLDILRALCISDWQSEPKMQHQNHSERRYQTIKTAANRIMDRTGAPPSTWLLCLMYVCYLLNHTYNANIDNVPLTALTGETVDTSVLLQFSFWQKVYYRQFGTRFPSESKESVGHIVGISEHVGHTLT